MVKIIDWLESAVADARYGLRQLRSAPILVAAVILSLTIGLGASTAIFALVDAAILKPLPVADPGALVILEWTAEAAIRSSVDSASIAHIVRQAVASVDPSVPMTEFHTQAGLIDRTLRTERMWA